VTRPYHARSSWGASLATTAALGILAAFAAGCHANTTGDPPAQPLANKCGDGTHISSVLGGFYGPADGWVRLADPSSATCKYPDNILVPGPLFPPATCLIVTAVDRHDETGNGAVGTVYVQDTVPAGVPIPKYAGISLFSPSFSPPDLRVQPGDVVDFTGDFEEFPGPSSSPFTYCQTLPQLAGAASFRFDGTVPPPVVIKPSDLTDYEGARAYLGMLVTVTDVTITSTMAASGRYTAGVAILNGTPWQISDELFDISGAIPPNSAPHFDSVTGIVTYFYSFHVAPRSLDDLNGSNLVLDAGTGSDGGADAGDGG
jgi:hypothetical protein